MENSHRAMVLATLLHFAFACNGSGSRIGQQVPGQPGPLAAKGADADIVETGGVASEMSEGSSSAGNGQSSGGGSSNVSVRSGDVKVDENATNNVETIVNNAGRLNEAAETGGKNAEESNSSVSGDPGETEPESEVNSKSMFHVFLLLGQSNMAGYPKAQPEDRVEDDRILVLGFDNCSQTERVTEQWDTAAPPLHECWNDGLGPGDYFAKRLIEQYPKGDTIGLVPAAFSGEAIETFMKNGGEHYDTILRRARIAQSAGGSIEGFLFHQGESNNGDPNWPANVGTFVADLRADLELGSVPFLAGELLYSGGGANHNLLVNQVPGVVSNGHVVSAEGLAMDPRDTQWRLHFSRDAVVEFGRRYADKLIEVLAL